MNKLSLGGFWTIFICYHFYTEIKKYVCRHNWNKRAADVEVDSEHHLVVESGQNFESILKNQVALMAH